MTTIPREWVFEHYLHLGVCLSGQDVNILSVFNSKDTKPSMFVYVDRTTRRYMYKDFSSDKGGDGTDLVQNLFNLTTRGEAAHKIISDYNKYVLSDVKAYAREQFKLREKYKVVAHQTRPWSVMDKKYWTAYYIGSDILNFYKVVPLSEYLLRKEENGKVSEILIKVHRAYGYFKEDGTLYKIYQPNNKDSKFIKVLAHIQGYEQLTFKVPYLVICSSIKDMSALKRLKFSNIEMIAPDSENSLIDAEVIAFLKTKYKAICTLFDNDTAGIKSMERYHEQLGLPFAHLQIEKDLAECLKTHGPSNTRVLVQPLLKNALNSMTQNENTSN